MGGVGFAFGEEEEEVGRGGFGLGKEDGGAGLNFLSLLLLREEGDAEVADAVVL